VVVCGNQAEAKRLDELVAQQEQDRKAQTGLCFVEGRLSQGFLWPALALAVVPHHELFHRYVQRRVPRRPLTARAIEDILELEPGDFVVHVEHGIGRFRGMETLERDGREEEFLTLEFADRVRLYVPASRIELVQKYIGGFQGRPELSRLGATAWARRKEMVAEALGGLAHEMLEVQAARASEPGIAYPPDDDLQVQFEAEFPYEETEDQLAVLAEVKRDMMAPRPMDRLICGDVGYGKTELAIRAAFKTALAGRQTAVLVPTTVLAQQHHRTFAERLADYPVRVAELSRFRTREEQRHILQALAAGAIDILIGTHRLLQEDVCFRDLGLVIIDEEQRFGVAHKEYLKRLRRTVDVLTLTATPIPRTLHMSLLGLRDVSVLSTPPQDRLAIRTVVIAFDRPRIREAILHEMARGGQVFFVHNRVWNIEEVADEVRTLVPEARSTVAHGQMPEHLLEQRMVEFLDRKVDVLVTTTIIQSGLDIPNANTIIIDEADTFGLADLHQLRGRVGRYKHRAYAYFLLPRQRVLTGPARRRLKAIEEYAQLGAGFRIALRDLEIRGAGNILGPEQSGHIAAIGYELYRQLLAQAIRRARGEPEPQRFEAYVDLRLAAYFPTDYITTDAEKMALYRRLCQGRTREALEELSHELRDRFGPLPPQARLLLERQALRLSAAEVGITSMVRTEDRVIVHFEDARRAAPVLARAGHIARELDPHSVHIYPFPSDLGPEDTVAFFRKVLQVQPVAVE
jgi:transcription-repair coupling factor (superfamily II helicase)